MKIIRICQHCSKEFSADKREVTRGNAKYCSLSCSSKRQRLLVKKPDANCRCAWCEKDFYRNLSKQKNARATGLQFCSRICKDSAQRIGGIAEIQPDHYGEGISRYRDNAFRKYPHKCIDCEYDKFVEVLEVHHLSGDRRKKDVVIICPTCHSERHCGFRENKDYDGNIVYIPLKGIGSLPSMGP